MNVKLDITPEQINDLIVKSVVESAIGESLKDIIELKVKAFKSTYNNPMEPIIEKMINEMMLKLVEEDYKEAIEAYVKEHVTEDIVKELVSKMWDHYISRHRR